MQARGAEWLHRVHPAHELNGLQFASEFQFQNLADREPVRGGERQRLQCRPVQVCIRRRQPSYRECYLGFGAVPQLMRVAGSQHCIGNAAAHAVSHIAVQRQRSCGEQGMLYRKTCAHVGSAAVAL